MQKPEKSAERHMYIYLSSDCSVRQIVPLRDIKVGSAQWIQCSASSIDFQGSKTSSAVVFD